MAVTVGIGQLGAELKRRRAELGLGLRKVEEQTGISAATLSRLERGSTPEVAIIEKVARWLGVNVQAARQGPEDVVTDEDLKRTIFVHLRAKKKLPEPVAKAIAESFDVVMRMELEKRRR